MKKYPVIVLVLGFALLASGCLTWQLKPGATAADGSAFKSLPAGQKMGLAEFTGVHKVQFSRGQFCLVVTCLPVGVAVGQKTMSRDTYRAGDPAKQAPLDNAEDNYVDDLNRACAREIEKTLSASRLFAYMPMAEMKGSWPKREDDQAAVRKLIQENKLSGAITAEMTYILLVGGTKPVGLATRWNVLDADGKVRATIQTCVAAASGLEAFPRTKDPKYHDRFVELVRQSAEDFVLMAKGEKPVHSRPLSAQP